MAYVVTRSTDGRFIVRYASGQSHDGVHAPKGGVTVKGKHYEGGQYIPGDVIRSLGKHQRDTLSKEIEDQTGEEYHPDSLRVQLLSMSKKDEHAISKPVNKSELPAAFANSPSLRSHAHPMVAYPYDEYSKTFVPIPIGHLKLPKPPRVPTDLSVLSRNQLVKLRGRVQQWLGQGQELLESTINKKSFSKHFFGDISVLDTGELPYSSESSYSENRKSPGVALMDSNPVYHAMQMISYQILKMVEHLDKQGDRKVLPQDAINSLFVTPEQSQFPDVDESDPKVQKAREEFQRHGVKSKKFKAWFGDWEKDPENSSQVRALLSGEPRRVYMGKAKRSLAIDPNTGEPVTVHHGGPGGIKYFDFTRSDEGNLYGPASAYTTESPEVAQGYRDSKGGEPQYILKNGAASVKAISQELATRLQERQPEYGRLLKTAIDHREGFLQEISRSWPEKDKQDILDRLRQRCDRWLHDNTQITPSRITSLIEDYRYPHKFHLNEDSTSWKKLQEATNSFLEFNINHGYNGQVLHKLGIAMDQQGNVLTNDLDGSAEDFHKEYKANDSVAVHTLSGAIETAKGIGISDSWIDSHITSNFPNVYQMYANIRDPFWIDKHALPEDFKRITDGIKKHQRFFRLSDKDVQDFTDSLNSLLDADVSNRASLPLNLKDRDIPVIFGDDIWSDLKESFNKRFPAGSGRTYANALLAKCGYDGITHIGRGTWGGNNYATHRVWIAFRPQQLKSVDNLGTFNKKDRRIKHAVSQAPDGRFIVRYAFDESKHPRGNPKNKGQFAKKGTSAPARPVDPTPAEPAWEDLSAAGEAYKTQGIRSPWFKRWFGDWERSPETASKVVNPATGEPQHTASYSGPISRVTDSENVPLEVYHGSQTDFESFNPGFDRGDNFYGNGFYFTSDMDVAKHYVRAEKSVVLRFSDDSHRRLLSLLEPSNREATEKHVVLTNVRHQLEHARNQCHVLMSFIKDMDSLSESVKNKGIMLATDFQNAIKDLPLDYGLSRTSDKRSDKVKGLRSIHKLLENWAVKHLSKNPAVPLQVRSLASDIGNDALDVHSLARECKEDLDDIADVVQDDPYYVTNEAAYPHIRDVLSSLNVTYDYEDGPGHVHKCFLRIANPLDMDKPIPDAQRQAMMNALGNDAKRISLYKLDNATTTGDDLCRSIGANHQKFRSLLQDSNIDGLMHTERSRLGNESRLHRVYIAFRPEQVKRVDNQGTFDPEDSRMKYVVSQSADGRYLVRYAFDETKHPRGNPKNRGEFAKKGTAAPAPAQSFPAEPNWSDTKSASKEYKQQGIRSRWFKRWFGDWENDPVESSQVIDETKNEPQVTHPVASSKVKDQIGQPVVVYHGTPAGHFKFFDPEKDGGQNLYGKGFYFTEDRRVAAGDPEMGEGYATKDAEAARVLSYNKPDPSIVKPLNILGELFSKTADEQLNLRDGHDPKSHAYYEHTSRANVFLNASEELHKMSVMAERGENLEKPITSFQTAHGVILDFEHLEEPDLVAFADALMHKPFACSSNLRPIFQEIADKSGVRVEKEPEPHVHECYLSIKNPLDMDKPLPRDMQKAMGNKCLEALNTMAFRKIQRGLKPEQIHSSYEHKRLKEQVDKLFGQPITGSEAFSIMRHQFRPILEQHGIDGLTHVGKGTWGGSSFNPHRVWIAFKPEQIKDIGNRGTFDPDDKRTRYTRPATLERTDEKTDREDRNDRQRRFDESKHPRGNLRNRGEFAKKGTASKGAFDPSMYEDGKPLDFAIHPDGSGILDWMHHHYSSWAGQLTHEQHRSIRFFQKDNSFSLMSWLRGQLGINKKPRSMYTDIDDLKEHARNIDTALEKSSLPANMILYRGLSTDSFIRGSQSQQDAVGLEFTDRSFVSTSLDPDVALSFAKIKNDENGMPQPSNPAIFRIHAPKGMPGAAVTVRTGAYPHECEITLPRNSRFRITAVSTHKAPKWNNMSRTITFYEAEYLGPDESDKQHYERTTDVTPTRPERFTWNPGDVVIHPRPPAGGDKKDKTQDPVPAKYARGTKQDGVHAPKGGITVKGTFYHGVAQLQELKRLYGGKVVIDQGIKPDRRLIH